MADTILSRRSFAKGAGLCAGAAGLVAIPGVARADEGKAGCTFPQTVVWDAEYDVVVLGMGFAGLSAAIAAADKGASVLLCDAAPDGAAGGNSKVCGQMFVNTKGDVEAARDYFGALAGDMYLPEGVLDTLAEGIADIDDIVARIADLDPTDFTDAMEVLGMGASYPEFPGAENVSLWCATGFYGQSYLYEAVRTNLATHYADKVDVWFASPARSLIQDGVSKEVVGVEIERGEGMRRVRALNGVVVACGGFENNARMAQTYLNIYESAGYGTPYALGDGIKMCQKVGAELAHMVPYATGGLAGCGFWVEDGSTTMAPSGAAYTSGACIVVGNEGGRFANETAAARYGMVSDDNGTWRSPRPAKRTFFVCDQTQMDVIGEAGGLPGIYTQPVEAYASIAEAAAFIGCDAYVLQQTIEAFNSYAEDGCDLDFARDSSTMRAFDGQAYYVVMLKPMLAWTLGGPLRDVSCRVIDTQGNPIPHLYSAGEMGNAAACMYQSGLAVADCFIFGIIAGEGAAAGEGVELPAVYDTTSVAESTPAHLGDETDLLS